MICKLLCSGEKEVDLAVQSAKAAFKIWSQLSGMERSRVLLEAARIIRVRCGSSPPLLQRGGSVSELSCGLTWLLGTSSRSAELQEDCGSSPQLRVKSHGLALGRALVLSLCSSPVCTFLT